MAQQDLAGQGQGKRPSEFADACAAIRDVPHRGMSGRCHHQACAHTHAVPRGRYLLEHRQQHGELVAVCGRIPRLSRPGREVVRGRQGALLRALQATGHTERLSDGAECAVVYTGTDPPTRREQTSSPAVSESTSWSASSSEDASRLGSA